MELLGEVQSIHPINANQPSSAHQQPNDGSTNPDTFEELSPCQSVGIQLECPHHPVQDLLVLSNQRRTIRRIELLNLFELDLPELGH